MDYLRCSFDLSTSLSGTVNRLKAELARVEAFKAVSVCKEKVLEYWELHVREL